jgi:hypothetical protein
VLIAENLTILTAKALNVEVGWTEDSKKTGGSNPKSLKSKRCCRRPTPQAIGSVALRTTSCTLHCKHHQLFAGFQPVIDKK